jgi:threonine dehydratase
MTTLERPADPTPTLDDIRAAAAALIDVAVRTPLLDAPELSERLGVPVALKLEHLQHIGAFKIRGAYTAVSRLSPAERARGIITHSSGNHGQAVASVGARFGVRTVIVMPETAPQVKVDGVRRHGAEIVFTKPTDRIRTAEAMAARDGLTLVAPYENRDVIAGQATCGLEIIEEWPDVETILVPVGGGGLLAGIASAVRALKPSVRVIGVEPAGAAKLSAALAAGRPVQLERSESIADGLLPLAIGGMPWAVLQQVVREAARVSEADIAAAVRYIFESLRLTVEPSAAVTTAALLAGHIRPAGPAVAIVSGGNVDPDLFRKLVH